MHSIFALVSMEFHFKLILIFKGKPFGLNIFSFPTVCLSLSVSLSLSHPLSRRSLSLSFSTLSAFADSLSWLWELIDKTTKT